MSLPIQYLVCPYCNGRVLPGVTGCPSCARVLQYCQAPSCRSPLIYPNQDIIVAYAPGKATVGGKSSLLGCEHRKETKDMVHVECILDYYNPQNHRDVYDALYDRLSAQIKIEIEDDIKRDLEGAQEEEIERRLGELIDGVGNGQLCSNCLEELEDYDRASPPPHPPSSYLPAPAPTVPSYPQSAAPYQAPAQHPAAAPAPAFVPPWANFGPGTR